MLSVIQTINISTIVLEPQEEHFMEGRACTNVHFNPDNVVFKGFKDRVNVQSSYNWILTQLKAQKVKKKLSCKSVQLLISEIELPNINTK